MLAHTFDVLFSLNEMMATLVDENEEVGDESDEAEAEAE